MCCRTEAVGMYFLKKKALAGMCMRIFLFGYKPNESFATKSMHPLNQACSYVGTEHGTLVSNYSLKCEWVDSSTYHVPIGQIENKYILATNLHFVKVHSDISKCQVHFCNYFAPC